MSKGLVFTLTAVMAMATLADAHQRVRLRTQARPIPTLLTSRGGRVAWYNTAGGAHEKIAFDRITDAVTLGTEVFTMDADGSNVVQVTGADFDAGDFIGQPEWHPDGLQLLIQAESENAAHTVYTHVSFGVDNDLWMIDSDGTDAQKVYDTPDGVAILHAHFNAAADKLVMARRDPTLETGFGGPDDENIWDGWSIQVCTYDNQQSGTSRISGCATIQPNGEGFYEPAGFNSAGRIIYSYGSDNFPGGIYASDTDGGNMTTVTDAGAFFEEFGHVSPVNDNIIAFVSSRIDPDNEFPPAVCCTTLKMELFVKRPDGVIQQATWMNQQRDWAVNAVVSDFDWNRTGTAFVYQEAIFGVGINIWKISY